MAAGIAAAGGRLLQAIASGRRRSVDRIGGLRALCALLVVCAGCASSSGQATSAGRAISLRADTLMLKPVDRGRLSSGYGIRYHPILKTRQMHPGIDWAAPRGTPVRAAGNGVVIAAERFSAYGYYVRVEHGRTVATTYAHLDSYAPGLRPGRLVRQGDLLGRVGSSGRATGPHLHYEILVAGHQVDPLAVSPVMHAHAANSAAPASEAGSEDELAIGGPADAAAADVAPGDAAAALGRELRSLPPDADGGLIRIENLLRLRP
jgi:murein DD-endopeptidase MepM/ murein hydrolase activator NlpD